MLAVKFFIIFLVRLRENIQQTNEKKHDQLIWTDFLSLFLEKTKPSPKGVHNMQTTF